NWSTPVQGQLQRPMAMDEFYNTVGRPDYADAWRVKRRTKIALVVSGGVLIGAGLAAGLGLILGAWEQGPCKVTDLSIYNGMCPSYLRGDDPLLEYTGAAVLAVGVAAGGAMMIAGGVINGQPITPD